MHVRRLTVAALSLLLPFAAIACGSDDDKADTAKTTTTAAKSDAAETDDSTDDATDTTEAPIPTLSQTDFDAAIKAFNTGLEEAGDDFCKITSATDALTISGAGSPEQAKQLYQAFADVLNAVSDHLPADSGADSATLKSAAKRIMSDAEADGYDPATLSSGSPEVFSDPEVAKSMAAVSEAITKNCPEA